jgi:hypothetical protein
MTDAERTSLEQGITVFAVSWTTEVNELKRNYAADFNFRKNSQANEHFTAIVSYLLEVCCVCACVYVCVSVSASVCLCIAVCFCVCTYIIICVYNYALTK